MGLFVPNLGGRMDAIKLSLREKKLMQKIVLLMLALSPSVVWNL